jgi:FkbM family methyltransferase
MKRLLQSAIHSLGFDLRRRRAHHESDDVEEIGVDHLLQVRLGSIREGEDFYFAQIGANDGGVNDHLQPFLSARNLRGLLVEPQTKPFQTLHQKYGDRDGISLHLGAIDVQTGTRVLYRVRDDIVSGEHSMFLTQLASFYRPQVVAGFKRYSRIFDLRLPADEAIVEEVVPTLTLSDLMLKYGMEKCDVLVIDTEGHDFEIIKSIDSCRIRPTILIYEHIHLAARDRLACWRLLRSQGYRCAADWMDTIALDASDLARPLRPFFPVLDTSCGGVAYGRAERPASGDELLPRAPAERGPGHWPCRP